MDTKRYTEFDDVWKALSTPGEDDKADVRLISLRWLARHAKKGGLRKVLPRRQVTLRL